MFTRTYLCTHAEEKVKLSPQQAVEAYRVERCWGIHIVYTISSQTALRFSPLCTSRALLPRNFIVSGIHFCWRMSKPQGLVQLEELDNLKKCNDLIRTWTCNLPACSIVPQPTTQSIFQIFLLLQCSLSYSNCWMVTACSACFCYRSLSYNTMTAGCFKILSITSSNQQ
jgi:hypothetical protein